MAEEIKVAKPEKVAEPVQSAQTDDIIRKPGVKPIEDPSASAKKTLDEVEKLKIEYEAKIAKERESMQTRYDELTRQKHELEEKASQPSTPIKKWEDLSVDELKKERTLARQDNASENDIDFINDLIHEKIAASKADTKVGSAENKFLKQQASKDAFDEIPELFNPDYTFNTTSDVYKELVKAYNQFPETVKNDPQAVLKLGRIAKEKVELKKLQDINKQATVDENHEKNSLEGSGVKTVEADNLTKLQQDAEAEVLSGNKTGPAGRAYLKALEKKQ